MPIESILILAGVVAAFAVFAATLAYASFIAGGKFDA